ncbi:hypothetical protein ACIA8H_12855 [Streptomyces goshikiensis]|uniref:hypothetical protein n=1 Tax=Streptomyces goshikiensis TaxID=1942 RepID=UPI0037ABC1CE
MAVRDKKTLLTVGADFEASPYDMRGRTEWPPASPGEVIAARSAWDPPYGQPPLPAAPMWITPSDGSDASSKGIQLFWKSNVGAIPAGSVATGTGSAGLDGLGITGHLLYIAEGATPRAEPSLTLGPLRNLILEGFQTPAGWVPIKPETQYSLQIAAVNSAGAGPRSGVLRLTTGS